MHSAKSASNDRAGRRPPLLLGFAVGSALNIVNAVACHAVICRELGEPLS